MSFNLPIANPSNPALEQALQKKIDAKTKPLGSLGKIEHLALQIGLVQETLTPTLRKPTIVIFAGDHGITAEGVSAYPAEVTAQMVLNFTAGNAAINVFARQSGMAVNIVDAGVNTDFPADLPIFHAKIAKGTKNFLQEAAMTNSQMEQAMKQGSEIIASLAGQGTNIVGFGEMGIGNTSAAAAIMHLITQKPLEYCVGAGTGVEGKNLIHKKNVISQAVKKFFADKTENPSSAENTSKASVSALEVLSYFGGFEIAMMCGAMLEAVSRKMLIIVDGFIATAALLVAQALQPTILSYCIFSHESDENGHASMLKFLGVEPLLRLSLRLGEGTGAALSYPIVLAAVNFLSEMASFESAQVSEKII